MKKKGVISTGILVALVLVLLVIVIVSLFKTFGPHSLFNSSMPYDLLIDNTWVLEDIASAPVSTMVDDPVYGDNLGKSENMTLDFDANRKFSMNDFTNDVIYTGTYSAEDTLNSIKLELLFDNAPDNIIIGGCSTKVEPGKENISTITFGMDEYILSFIAEE